MAEFEENIDESWASFEGECQGCDLFGRVNDLWLCQECAAKLERDLIRQRDWQYSTTAYGLSSDAREELRLRVLVQHGKAFELLSAPEKASKGRRRKKKGGRENET